MDSGVQSTSTRNALQLEASWSPETLPGPLSRDPGVFRLFSPVARCFCSECWETLGPHRTRPGEGHPGRVCQEVGLAPEALRHPRGATRTLSRAVPLGGWPDARAAPLGTRVPLQGLCAPSATVTWPPTRAWLPARLCAGCGRVPQRADGALSVGHWIGARVTRFLSGKQTFPRGARHAHWSRPCRQGLET